MMAWLTTGIRLIDTATSADLFPGVVLLFVGLAFLFNFSQWWPIILIAVGVVILLGFFLAEDKLYLTFIFDMKDHTDEKPVPYYDTGSVSSRRLDSGSGPE